jgi:LAS superfamily LD-carboxypeptidase LdcB
MLKGSDIRGFLVALLVVALIAAAVVWRVRSHSQVAPPPPAPAIPALAKAPPTGTCDPAAWRGAAAANRVSLETLPWSPFRRPETGWAIYAPLVAREIATACAPDSAGFAESLARWQAAQKRPADGVFRPQDFDLMRDAMALRRPFVQATAQGACPAAPDPATLAWSRPDEGFAGKIVQLRPGALDAWRRMLAAARAERLAARPPRLLLVSGFRGAAEEAARCEGGACDTVARASCSAHRTGLALDLYLEPAPGSDPISAADENRRHQAATPEYRWLVANAARFGFLPYAYEPWHWEWTGEPP